MRLRGLAACLGCLLLQCASLATLTAMPTDYLADHETYIGPGSCKRCAPGALGFAISTLSPLYGRAGHLSRLPARAAGQAGQLRQLQLMTPWASSGADGGGLLAG